jgi:putative tryptophan/tyrosine transport system substrate-binding protein
MRQRATVKKPIKKIFFLSLGAVLFAHCLSAQAQQPKRIPRIGILSDTVVARTEAFRQGLRELGYVEGKNLIVVYPSASGTAAARAAELVRLKVDVIATGGATTTRAAKEATSTIPIVFLQDPDPVGNGLVTSLGRPAGNLTGLSQMTADLAGKRLELLRAVLPKLSRLGVLGNSANAGNGIQLRETERAASTVGVQLQYLDILSAKDIETAFREANKERAEAVLLLGGPVFNANRTLLAQYAVKSRLPAAYNLSEYVEAGGLMSYGANRADLDRRAATYVDKILKGAKPADLPVEQPKKFDFVINLKAAQQIGLIIPPNVLARADRVIK